MVDLDTVNASWALSACVPVSFLRYILTFFGGMPDSRTSYRDQLSRATVAARLDSGPPGECIDFFLKSLRAPGARLQLSASDVSTRSVVS